MKGLRAGAGLAMAALLVLALPAAAPAAKKPAKPGKVKTRSSTSSAAGDGAIVTTTALCPAKHSAVGGGFSESVPTNGGFGLVYESVRSGQRGWRVSAQSFETMPPVDVITLTAYAYCRKNAAKTKPVSLTAATPLANQTGPTVQAICPKARQALAGGFATSPPLVANSARPLMLESVRSGTSSWQSLVLSGTSHSGTITSHAYCAAKTKAPSTVSAVSPPITTGLAVTSASAACPSKKTALHGGFTQTGATSSNLMAIYESQRVGNAWRVSGVHLGTESSTVGAQAYCG